jgi:hypothetical protein
VAAKACRPACDVRFQFVVWTGREPNEIRLAANDIAIIEKTGAEIDFDLYYNEEPAFDESECKTCRIRLPLTYERIRPYIGAEARIAEIQLKFRVYEVEGGEGRARFELWDDDERPIRPLSLAYLERDRCLQFSTHSVPTSTIEAITPAVWIRRFLKEMKPHIPLLPNEVHRREFVLDLTERGHVQGSVWLRLEANLLRWLTKRQSDLRVRLAWAPRPSFRGQGECMYCVRRG